MEAVQECIFTTMKKIENIRYHHIGYWKEVLAAWDKFCEKERLSDIYSRHNVIRFAQYFSSQEQRELVENTQYAVMYLQKLNGDYDHDIDISEIITFCDPYTDLDLSKCKFDDNLLKILKEELAKVINYFEDQFGFHISEFDQGFMQLKYEYHQLFKERLRRVFTNIVAFIELINIYPNHVVNLSTELDDLCTEPVIGNHCDESCKDIFPDSVSPADEKYKEIYGVHPRSISILMQSSVA